jgi:ankyrin repeat protein
MRYSIFFLRLLGFILAVGSDQAIYSMDTREGEIYKNNESLVKWAKEGDRGMVRHFIRQNANVNHTFSGGRNALFYATRNGDIAMIELLISKGARWSGESDSLFNLIRKDDISTVTLLINSGANVEGSSLLQFAKSADMVKLLLTNGAYPFFKQTNGKTIYENNPVVKQIVDEKAFSDFVPHFAVRSVETATIHATHESALLPTEILKMIRDYVTGPTFYNPKRDLSLPENNPKWKTTEN